MLCGIFGVSMFLHMESMLWVLGILLIFVDGAHIFPLITGHTVCTAIARYSIY